MLDIEKINIELFKRTNLNQKVLLREKLNMEIDEQWLSGELAEILSLTWKASNFESSNLYEEHLQLKRYIVNLYNEICHRINYDFGAKYLTDKLRVCVNVYNTLTYTAGKCVSVSVN